MIATSWTAVASAARHRFRPLDTLPNLLDCPSARKRRRRFALPAHSIIKSGLLPASVRACGVKRSPWRVNNSGR